MTPRIPLTPEQSTILRTALAQLLYAHDANEAAQLDKLADRGWLVKQHSKVRRGDFQTNTIYFLTPAGRRAARKLLDGGGV